MKLQYLGTAAAEAIPGLFCQCKTCTLARERGGREIRTRSQALINDTLLIDFPSDTLHHALQFGLDLRSINHCLVTHVHGDHLFPWELGNVREGRASLPADYEGLHLYGSEDVAEICAEQLALCKGRLQIHTVKPFSPFWIGNLRVTALKARHRTPNPYVYIVEDGDAALLYAHDTREFPEETVAYLKAAAPKFKLVSLDCTGGNSDEKPEIYSHMYLKSNLRCRELLFSLGLADRETVFLLNHFSHYGSDVNYREFCEIAEPLGFSVSYDGMTVKTE